MTAAEKAMQEIQAAMDAFYNGDTTASDTLNAIAWTTGAYSVERIGDGE